MIKYFGFLDILKSKKLDTIGILDTNNNPKIYNSINSVFKFLNKIEVFCIKHNL